MSSVVNLFINMPVFNSPFKAFNYGLFNKNPIQNIPDGAASDSLNWLTNNGKIELVRGYAPLGTEINGAGRTTGLIAGVKADGTEVPFSSYGQKVRYYDSVLLDWVEIGSNILGSAANGEDITFARFDSRAGKQVWFNSPNSGPKKIMSANPGSYTDLYDASKNYKAWLAMKGNQAYNWNISNTDRNVVRMSYIETRSVTDYTQIINEGIGTGDGVTKTFTGTLAFKAGNLTRTALDVTATDSVETFTDTLNGTLNGSLGGTATINYTTGTYSITFNTAPLSLANVLATYRWVDETATGGIANFVVPGSRVSGDPNVFPQSTGGDIKSLYSLKEHRFVGHRKTIYDIQLTLDDSDATNFIFRENQGIPSLRGGVEAPEGIYTIDTSDENNPRFVLITFNDYSAEIVPTIISSRIDLIGYNFNNAVVFIWNDFILFGCQSPTGTANDTVFLFHRIYKTFDKLDYCVSCFDTYLGGLIAGDSLTSNVYQLFSGLDANGTSINNYWKSGISKLSRPSTRGKLYPLTQLKKVKKVSLEGEIGPNQTIQMWVSLDRGPFVEVLDKDGNSFIQGTGDYVDHSQRVTIGAPTLGRTEIGGGTNGIEAYHYNREISFGQDKFFEIEIMFVAADIGYASITDCEFRDVRIKQNKVARKYRV